MPSRSRRHGTWLQQAWVRLLHATPFRWAIGLEQDRTGRRTVIEPTSAGADPAEGRLVACLGECDQAARRLGAGTLDHSETDITHRRCHGFAREARQQHVPQADLQFMRVQMWMP